MTTTTRTEVRDATVLAYPAWFYQSKKKPNFIVLASTYTFAPWLAPLLAPLLAPCKFGVNTAVWAGHPRLLSLYCCIVFLVSSCVRLPRRMFVFMYDVMS